MRSSCLSKGSVGGGIRSQPSVKPSRAIACATAKTSRSGLMRDGLKSGIALGALVALWKELPAEAGVGADETEVLSEDVIPELERDLADADVPPAAKQALEEEVESIETEIGQVEEEVTEGASEAVVEEDVGGIFQRIEAFTSLFSSK